MLFYPPVRLSDLFDFVHHMFHFDTVLKYVKRVSLHKNLKYQSFRLFGIIHVLPYGNTFGL